VLERCERIGSLLRKKDTHIKQVFGCWLANYVQIVRLKDLLGLGVTEADTGIVHTYSLGLVLFNNNQSVLHLVKNSLQLNFLFLKMMFV
jgi:hypothetical protein